MQQLPIPDDWTEPDGYILLLACFPDSLYWRSIARGQIHNLTRGRTWDADTGDVKAVQAIGWQIYNSVMTCKLDDLVTGIGQLNLTITNQQQVLADIVLGLYRIHAAIETSAANLGSLEDIKIALEHIRTAVELSGSDDLEDDLANVWGVLQSISTVLGGNVPSPPNPL